MKSSTNDPGKDTAILVLLSYFALFDANLEMRFGLSVR
jgi:hypothetical protein